MITDYKNEELEGDWAVFAKIAGFFVYKVSPDDREDFYHNLLVEMAKVKAKYAVRRKPLTEASLMRVASYELKGYWDKRRFRLFGLNCTHCTIEQRRECRATKELSQCPKRKTRLLLSLNKIMGDGDGDNLTELGDLIADDKSIDLVARLDARAILQRLPKREVRIGYKVYAGIPLETEERRYLKRWQKTYPSTFAWSQKRNHLDKRILELLHKHPKGLTRSDLSTCLLVRVREINFYLNPLLKRQQVIAVRRENTRGQSSSPLFFIAGAEMPEEEVKAARIRIVTDERVVEILRNKPQGMTKRDLSSRLNVPIWIINLYLNPLIERHQVIAVRRENTRGRPLSPLFFLAGAEIPEMKMVKVERDDRIRQVHFTEGWSIKRINRELHHDKKTIRRVIRSVEQPALV